MLPMPHEAIVQIPVDFPAMYTILVSLGLLHPKEELLGPHLKLEHIDPPTGALRHLLELNVIRKEIKSSSTVPEVLSSQQK